MQNTSQKNSANVTFTSGKCPLEAQFRNTRTPAGFEPKACKTQARKTLRQKNSPNVTFGIHKKQQFYRPWDASPARKTIGKCPLEAQFRNTWTPAGFQPKACKTQARKTLRTLPLEPIKNNNSIAREIASPASKTIGKCPLEAQFRNIWTPAGFQPKAWTQARKTLRTLPLPVANVPWRHSSETLEHQQDSSPRHAKHKPKKLSERYLWNP